MEPVIVIFTMCAVPAAVFLIPAFWRSKERMRLLDIVKLTAEQGQPLPEAVIRSLPGAFTPPHSPKRDFRRGVVLVALALAFFIIGGCVYAALSTIPDKDSDSIATVFGTIIAGIGAIPLCTGLALIVLGKTDKTLTAD